MVGVVRHLRIKVGKNGRALVVVGMLRIVDAEVLDGDAFGHVAGITKVVQARIRTTDEVGAGWFAARRNKNAVANDELTLPRTAVVGAKVDDASATNGGVFDQKRTASNGIDTHVSEGGIADGGVGYTLVRVKTREGTAVVQQVFAKIGAQNTPIRIVVDAVGLVTINKRYIHRPIDRQVVSAHRNRLARRANGTVRAVARQQSVFDGDVGTITDVDKSAVRRTVFAFARDAVFESFDKYV